jgi:hypothetical protein
MFEVCSICAILFSSLLIQLYITNSLWNRNLYCAAWSKIL